MSTGAVISAIVEGSVFRTGETVRTRVQLLRALPAERHLCAGAFQGDLRDILSLQAEVARGIAERFHVVLTED